MLAFLARTPLKLAMVDRRRDRELERSSLARRLGAVEVVAIAALGALALLGAGGQWLVPVAVALPLFAVERLGSTYGAVAVDWCRSCAAPRGWAQ